MRARQTVGRSASSSSRSSSSAPAAASSRRASSASGGVFFLARAEARPQPLELRTDAAGGDQRREPGVGVDRAARREHRERARDEPELERAAERRSRQRGLAAQLLLERFEELGGEL